MTPDEFCRWLHGFFELGQPNQINRRQTELIKQHLALVYANVTSANVTIWACNPLAPKLDSETTLNASTSTTGAAEAAEASEAAKVSEDAAAESSSSSSSPSAS